MKRLGLIDNCKGTLKVIPITKDVDLFAMEKEWNCLLYENHTYTIFLTWEWITAWWRAYGLSQELYILRVEKDGRLIGLAPFYRKMISRFGGLLFRSLALLGDGSGDSDYLDWISKNGEEEVVTKAVIDFLSQNCREWDLLLLNEMSDIVSPHLPLLRKLSGQIGWYWEEEEVPCTYVELPSDWEEYLRSLKPRMRNKVRSLTKQLEKSFRVGFDYCQQAEELKPRLKSLFDLHTRRWHSVGQEGVFGSPAKRRFYHEISSLFLTRGWLRFYSLAVDDVYVAHQFCFEYQNKMFLLQEGFDPNWDKYGIGNVLRAYVFRDCIERQIALYDFLRGVTPHKLSWGGEVKKSICGVMGIPRIKNKIYFELSKAFDKGKKGLRPMLPETILRWGRHLRSEKFRGVGSVESSESCIRSLDL
jgi:CelD/BcsL family acetyltransferase involved in cellulose biosynthesis